MKIKIEIFIITFITLFVLSSILSCSLNSNLKTTDKNIQYDEINKIDEFRIPKKLWFNNSMDPIVIDNSASNNWTWARNQEWCRFGNGSRDNPYIIENITIDAGGSGNGILIENSINVYFEINNCTVYNSGPSWEVAGIILINTTKGRIINNTCSLNSNGIRIHKSNNNTILNNTAKNNDRKGISITQSHNNTLSGNIANDNSNYGIYIAYSHNNNISGNTANNNDYGIYLQYSHNNTISFCTVLFNNLDGIHILGPCYNNTVSGNTAYINEYHGIFLKHNFDSTISGNTANKNSFGITLSYSNNNTVSGNTVNNNVIGIGIFISNNNTVSGNTLIADTYFIYESGGSIDNTIKDNTCYTTILPGGINELSIEPYGVDNIDVNLSIALNDTTAVLFSAFNNNTSDVPLDNGLIFMNLQLNESDNLNQTFDAPINITLKIDVNKYKAINTFWFNESANGGQGAWIEIPFTDLSNGIIVISLNHTSLFALNGELKSVHLSKDDNDDDINNEINILFIIIIAIIIGLMGSIAASSIYYYKTSAMPTKKERLIKKPLFKSFDEKIIKLPNLKEYLDDQILLKILEEKNGLAKIASLGDLNITTISPDFWEKIDMFDWNENEREVFIREMLSLLPKERQEIFNDMLRKKNRRNSSIRSNEIIREKRNSKEYLDDQILLKILEEKNGLAKIASLGDLNITTISPDFWEKIDLFDWNENEREVFIREMLSLPPKERQEILNDILKKSMIVRKK
ncbi:MAG: nitrous oxide reductase family maturation protein NosD [Candidatus Hodarchaeota archaeon]